MAITEVTFSGVNFGGVLSHNPKSNYPCIDSSYQELTWDFEFYKEHASISAMNTFEKTTIPGLFSSGDRTGSLNYAGFSHNDVFLQSVERVGNPDIDIEGKFYAKYRAVFTKEDA